MHAHIIAVMRLLLSKKNTLLRTHTSYFKVINYTRVRDGGNFTPTREHVDQKWIFELLVIWRIQY